MVAEAPPRRLLPSPRATAAAALGAVPGLWSGRKGRGPKVTGCRPQKKIVGTSTALTWGGLREPGHLELRHGSISPKGRSAFLGLSLGPGADARDGEERIKASQSPEVARTSPLPRGTAGVHDLPITAPTSSRLPPSSDSPAGARRCTSPAHVRPLNLHRPSVKSGLQNTPGLSKQEKRRPRAIQWPPKRTDGADLILAVWQI